MQNLSFFLSFSEHKDSKFHHGIFVSQISLYIRNNYTCSHLQKHLIKRPTLFQSSPSRPSVSSCTLLDPPNVACCSSSPVGEATPALNSLFLSLSHAKMHTVKVRCTYRKGPFPDISVHSADSPNITSTRTHGFRRVIMRHRS